MSDWSIMIGFVATYIQPNDIKWDDMNIIKQRGMNCFGKSKIPEILGAKHIIYLKENGFLVGFCCIEENSTIIEIYLSCAENGDYLKVLLEHVIYKADKTKELCIVVHDKDINAIPLYTSIGFVKPTFSITKKGRLESKGGRILNTSCLQLIYSEKSSKKSKNNATRYAIKLLNILNTNFVQWSVHQNSLATLTDISKLSLENINILSDKLISNGITPDKTEADLIIKKATHIIILLNLDGDITAFCTVEIISNEIQITCMCKIGTGIFPDLLVKHIIDFNDSSELSALVDSREEVDFYSDLRFRSEDLVMKTALGNRLVSPKLKVIYKESQTIADIKSSKERGYNLIHINFSENRWSIKDGYMAYALSPSMIDDKDIDLLAQQLIGCYDLSVSDAKKEIMSCDYVAWLSSTSASKLTFCLINREKDTRQIQNTEILRICTADVHRKKGNAKILIEHIIDRAKDSSLWLNIYTPSAVSLCRIGFIKPIIVNINIKGKPVSPSMVRLIYDEKSNGQDRSAAEITTRNYLDLIKDSRGQKNRVEIHKDSLKIIYEKLLHDDTEWGGRLEYDPIDKTLSIQDLVKGQKTTIYIPCHNMRFHTHPAIAYEENELGVAPMSTHDCAAVMTCLDSFHVIFAMEAIYVIEFNNKVHGYLNDSAIYHNAEYNAFYNSISTILTDLVSSVYQLSNSLKRYIDILVKSNNGDILATVDDDQRFISNCSKWIFKIIQLFTGITIQKVINNDKSGLLKSSIKLNSIPKNTSVYDIHVTMNPYGLYRKGIPVNVHHRQF